MAVIKLGPGLYAELVESEDDNGWYFTAFDDQGFNVHTPTDIWASERDARVAARYWAQGYQSRKAKNHGAR